MSSLKFRLGANNMQSKSMILARPIALAIGAALVLGTIAAPADAAPRKKARAKVAKIVRTRAIPTGVQRPSGEINLSTGRGQLVTLPAPIADVFVSNTAVADVQVNSPTQLYVFAKTEGEASVYATTRTGQVVYSTNVRVGANLNSLDQMLRLAMPDTDVKATVSGQVAVLTGTVKSPDDIQQAGDLARSFLNPGIDVSDPKTALKVMVVNRLRTATPLQVTLQVRIAEVSRSFSKNFGVKWTADNGAATGAGTQFAVDQGGLTVSGTGTVAQLSGRLLGLNILSQLDVGETEGFVTTLASPNLTAMSGEHATFLAGGEIPILNTITSNGGNTQSIVFKPYGITIEFVPTVLADGRISLVVKPEVSELDRTVNVGGVFGFTTRRVDTTVELGSGQSFVIGGLLKANNNNNMTKLPGAGDVPILGALFRSNAYQRGESELMIVVTPYLVKPVPASQIVLPTDGYKAPTELGRIFGGELYKGSNERRPMPTVKPAETVARPSIGAALSMPGADKTKGTAATPGFSN
jgi:pilus assembly protein CpaC